MARKKKNNVQIPQSLVKIFLVGLFSLAIGLALCKGVWYGLTHSPYFTIKSIVIEPSLQFINVRDIQRVKGKSIFTIDLTKIQERLGRRYPQVSQLRVVRRFPNTIYIGAKQRKPVAQAKIDKKVLTLDANGVVLSTTSKQNGKVPLIKGINSKNRRIALGQPFVGHDIRSALRLTEAFAENRTLDGYHIVEFDVSNISKIEMYLSNKLKVLVDKDHAGRKMRMLGLVLSKGELNLDEIRYLDLRFKEPIIGKK